MASVARAYFRCLRQWLLDLRIHRKVKLERGPPVFIRAFQQWKLLLSNGIDAEDYYAYRLYRSELSEPQKREYLGWFGYYRYFSALNPPLYDVLARDKMLFDALASALSLPVPLVRAVFATGVAGRFGKQPLLQSDAALREFLARDDAENIFIKPITGRYGSGALSLGEKLVDGTGWNSLPNHTPVTLDDVLRHMSGQQGLDGFLIQDCLVTHRALAEIVPGVCPTVRIMTLSSPRNVFLLGAALRLGNGDTPTDNISGGGVTAYVNLDNGLVGRALGLDDWIPKEVSCHPRTGSRITGVQIPFWKEICELMVEGAKHFGCFQCIGWDVAITDKGPVIVEINTFPRAKGIQSTADVGLLNGPLGSAINPSPIMNRT